MRKAVVAEDLGFTSTLSFSAALCCPPGAANRADPYQYRKSPSLSRRKDTISASTHVCLSTAWRLQTCQRRFCSGLIINIQALGGAKLFSLFQWRSLKTPIPHCLCLSTCVSVHPTSLQLLNSLAKHKAMGLQSRQSQGNLAMSPQASFQLETSSAFRHSPSLSSLTLVKFQINFKGKKGFLSYNKNKPENIYGQGTAKIFRAYLKIIFPPPPPFFFFFLP